MDDPDDDELPLRDEAKARHKWRGGETLLGGADPDSGPASEVDDAAKSNGDAGDRLLGDLAQRPPD